MTDKLLLEALELASEGRKNEARRLLHAVLRADNTNETAWLWLADCSDSLEERVQALETCLRRNPQASRARVALTRLRFTAWAADRQRAPIPLTGSLPANGVQPRNGSFRLAIDEPPTTPLDPFARPDPLAGGAELRTDGANVFTVSPEALSPEEFAAVEARAEKTMQNRPDLRPLKVQLARRRARTEDWNELSRTNGRRISRPRRDQTQPPPEPARKSQALVYSAAALFMLLVVVLVLSAMFLLPGG